MIYFFFNRTATTEIYTDLHTLSPHDALPLFGAAAIVAQRLGRPVAQEHRGGRLYAIEPCARLARRQDQVLGGVAVADLERGGQRVDLDQSRGDRKSTRLNSSH